MRHLIEGLLADVFHSLSASCVAYMSIPTIIMCMNVSLQLWWHHNKASNMRIHQKEAAT